MKPQHYLVKRIVFDSNVDSGEGYGKRVKKISRDQARDIARRVNDQLKKEWRQKHEDVVGDLRRNLVDSEVGVEVGTVDTAEILDQVPTPQPEAPIIDVAPTVEGPEHIEARPAPTDIKIDPVKIKVGFTVVLGSGQSAQVTRTTAKTVFYQNPTDPNKEGKISINKIVAVKDEGGKVVMGEGAITESLADMGLEKESKALALRISELNDLCTGLIALNERAATDSGVQKLKQDVEKLLVVLSAPDISQGTIDSVAKKVDLFTTAIDGYQRRYSRGREPIQMDVGKEMAPEDSAAPDAPILSSEDIKELEDNTPLGDVENEDDMLVVEENSSNTEEVKKIVDIIEEAPVADAQIDEIITEIKDPGSLYGGFKSFQLFIDQLDPAVREKIDPDVIIVNRLHDRYCELEPQLSPLDDQVSEELKEEVISIGVQIQQARERIKATLGEAIDKTWPESSFPDSLEMPPLSNEEQEVLRGS
jgi:hypothetical protein